MPKLKLLILDAGVVIKLHELGLWNVVVEKCDVYLSKIVAEREVKFHHADDEEWGEDIDLRALIETKKITIFEVTAADVSEFRKSFEDSYFVDLDDGEAESLSFLFKQQQDFLISSGDAIAYKVLGNTGRTDYGISLEEILKRIGFTKDLSWQYTQAFREKYSRDGSLDMIQGRGAKK
jgi:hypothetical protein